MKFYNFHTILSPHQRISAFRTPRHFVRAQAPALALAGLLAFGWGAPSSHAARKLTARTEGMTSGFRETIQTSGTAFREDTRSIHEGSDNLETLGRASASFGILRAVSEAHYSSDQTNLNPTTAKAIASFSDDISISAPGRSGSGLMDFDLLVSGFLFSSLQTLGAENFSSASTYSYAQGRLEVYRNGSGSPLLMNIERVRSDGSTEIIAGEAFVDRVVHVLNVPFNFGSTFELKVLLEAFTQARTEFGANSVANLGNTVQWGGITEVTSGAETVTDFTASGTSGTSYVGPIPEPAGAALLGLGAVSLAARRSRRSPLHLTR